MLPNYTYYGDEFTDWLRAKAAEYNARADADARKARIAVYVGAAAFAGLLYVIGLAVIT